MSIPLPELNRNFTNSNHFVRTSNNKGQRTKGLASSQAKQELMYFDWITLQRGENYVLALTEPKSMLPKIAHKDNITVAALSYFQIIPVLARNSGDMKIKLTDQFYLKHVESDLYLSLGNDEMICQQRDTVLDLSITFISLTEGERHLFSFETEQADRQIYAMTGRRMKLKMGNENKFIKIHMNQIEKEGSVWLEDNFDCFIIRIVSRKCTKHEKVVRNCDTVLLEINKELIGVRKIRQIVQKYEIPLENEGSRTDKQIETDQNQLYANLIRETQIYTDFFTAKNNIIESVATKDVQRELLMTYLWTIQKEEGKVEEKMSYFIRNQRAVRFKHLETGLCLGLTEDGMLFLKEDDGFGGDFIKISSLQQVKYEQNEHHDLRPIYFNSLLRLTFEKQSIVVQLTKVNSENYLLLFNTHFFCFLEGILSLFSRKDIGDSSVEIKEHISFYGYLYKLLQNKFQTIADKGYYYLQRTFLIFELIKNQFTKNDSFVFVKEKVETTINKLVPKYGSNGKDMIRNNYLAPLLTQMLRFVSLQLSKGDVLDKITLDNTDKIRSIVQSISAMFTFNTPITTNVLLLLAKQDPELVLQLLLDRLQIATTWMHKHCLIHGINNLVDRENDLDIDSGKLLKVLSKCHKFAIQAGQLTITEGMQELCLTQICEQLQQIRYLTRKQQNQPECQLNSSSRFRLEKMYHHLYLLEVMKILFNLKHDKKGQKRKLKKNNQRRQTQRQVFEIVKEQLIKCTDAKIQTNLIDILSAVLKEESTKLGLITHRLRFVIYLERDLTPDVELEEVLSLSARGSFELYLTKEQLLTLIYRGSVNDNREDAIILFGQRWQKWQVTNLLNYKLNYFSKMVDLLCILLTFPAYDIRTLNQVQQFAINILCLYSLDNEGLQCFRFTRRQIERYAVMQAEKVALGITALLQSLVQSLSKLFDIIYTHKLRLLSYPLLQDSRTLFKIDHYIKSYTSVLFNDHLNRELRVISDLIELYENKVTTQIVVFRRQQIEYTLSSELESIIEDINFFQLVMRNFSATSKQNQLYEQLVSSMHQRATRIQVSLKDIVKKQGFAKYSYAYGLINHIFQFLIQNTFQESLIKPIVTFLQCQIAPLDNFFSILQTNERQLINYISQATCPKIFLEWLCHCFKHGSTCPHDGIINKLYQYICEAIDVDLNTNILYLVEAIQDTATLLPAKEEELYSILVGLEIGQKYLAACKTMRRFTAFKLELENDSEFELTLHNFNNFFVTLFKVSQTNSKLLAHLSLFLDYDQIVNIIYQERRCFDLIRPFLSFLLTNPDLQTTSGFNIGKYLQLSHNFLSLNSIYLPELQNYKPNPLVRGNAYNNTTNNTSNNTANNTTNNASQPNKHQNNKKATIMKICYKNKQSYWQFLLCKSFCKFQGLLTFLQELIKKVCQSSYQEQYVNLLIKIEEYLGNILAGIETKSRKSNYEALELQVQKVRQLVKQCIPKQSYFGHSVPKTSDSQQIFKQIYELLKTQNLLKSFLGICQTEPAQVTNSEPESESEWQYSDKNNLASIGEISQHQLIIASQHYSKTRVHLVHQKEILLDSLQKIQIICGKRLIIRDRLFHLLIICCNNGISLVDVQRAIRVSIEIERDKTISYNKKSQLEYYLETLAITQVFEDPFLAQSIHADEHINQINQNAINMPLLRLRTLADNAQIEHLANTLHTLYSIYHKRIEDYNDTISVERISFDNATEECYWQLLISLLREEHRDSKTQRLYHLFAVQHLINIIRLMSVQPSKLERRIGQHFLSFMFKQLSLQQQKTTEDISTDTKMCLLLVLIFTDYEKLCGGFHLNLYVLVQQKCLAKLSPRQVSIAMQAVLMTLINLPLQLRRQILLQLLQTTFIVQFIQKAILSVMRSNPLSQNLLFYQQIDTLLMIFNFMQSASNSMLGDTCWRGVNTLIVQFIHLEIWVCQKVLTIQSIHVYRLRLFQDIIAQSFTLFASLRFNRGENLWTIQAFPERLRYVPELEEQQEEQGSIRRMYQSCQQQFDIVLVNGKEQPIIRAFPTHSLGTHWQSQLSMLLQESQSISQRKQILLSYSLLTSQEQLLTSQEQHHWSFMAHRYQPFLAYSSLVIVLLLCVVVFVLRSNWMWLIMDLLLAVNLCVVVLIIFKKIGTLVKIYSLRVLSDKNTSLLVFLLLYQKTVVALIMVTFLINCLAFAYQLLIPCMWIVHFLNYHHIMLQLFYRIRRNIRGLVAIAAVYVCIFVLLATLIDPVHDQHQIEALGITPKYNISYISVLYDRIFSTDLNWKTNFFFWVSKILTFYLATTFMVLYLDNSQLKQRINCKICPATCPEGENSSVDMTNHLLHVHSVYKYFRFFLYVLGKDQRDLALEEARICDSIRKKDSLIFF